MYNESIQLGREHHISDDHTIYINKVRQLKRKFDGFSFFCGGQTTELFNESG